VRCSSSSRESPDESIRLCHRDCSHGALNAPTRALAAGPAAPPQSRVLESAALAVAVLS
jgi:hypothetical protein